MKTDNLRYFFLSLLYKTWDTRTIRQTCTRYIRYNYHKRKFFDIIWKSYKLLATMMQQGNGPTLREPFKCQL